MLIIRRQQMAELERAQRRAFAEDTVSFIRTQYAEACAQFSPQDLTGMVAQALRKARDYNFTAHTDILRYINVMYTLGCDFDTDPRYPWARDILTNPRMRPRSKIDRLVARTLEHLRMLEQSQ
jgi:hypothetical protein